MTVRRQRRRRPKRPSKQIMITANDDEWEKVGTHADHRGMSKAAYLVALVARDVAGGQAGPPLVLARDEQRAVVEGLRELRRALCEDGDTPALIADIQVRIATMFDAWARDLVARGKQDALHHALASTIGDEQAGALVAALKKETRPAPTRTGKKKEAGPDLFSWSLET